MTEQQFTRRLQIAAAIAFVVNIGIISLLGSYTRSSLSRISTENFVLVSRLDSISNQYSDMNTIFVAAVDTRSPVPSADLEPLSPDDNDKLVTIEHNAADAKDTLFYLDAGNCLHTLYINRIRLYFYNYVFYFRDFVSKVYDTLAKPCSGSNFKANTQYYDWKHTKDGSISSYDYDFTFYSDNPNDPVLYIRLIGVKRGEDIFATLLWSSASSKVKLVGDTATHIKLVKKIWKAG